MGGMEEVSRVGHGRVLALDGVRGIAVLLVTLAHANVPFVRYGGITGVTLFFVLSGYLITTLLVRERDREGQVALGAFYARRALRLVPALALLLVGSTVIAVAFGNPIGDLGTPVLATSLYVANFVSGAGGEIFPFGGLWSLAMEEQYYLVWPLAMGVLVRWRSRTALVVVATLGAASLVARFLPDVGTAEGYRIAYYMPHTNAWALLAGSALALYLAARPWPVSPRAAAAAFAGLLLVATVMGLRTGLYERADATTYVLRLLAGPLAAACGVVVVAYAATARRTWAWLTHRWLLFFGAISYGLYLWHTTLDQIVAAELGRTGLRGMVVGLSTAVVAIGIAVLSKRYVEDPFLRHKHRFEPGRQRTPAPVPAPGLVPAPVSGFADETAG